MTDRYFKKEWEESYYIFDSETITEKEVDEAIEYDNKVFSQSMTGEIVLDRLNQYSKQLIEAGKLIENGVEIAKENRELRTANHELYKENTKLLETIEEMEEPVK